MSKLIMIAAGTLSGFVLAVALQLALGGSSSADAELATAAPVIPGASAATAPQPVNAPASAPANSNSHFAIDPAQSTAKILVQQTGLLGEATLVANGSNVTGDVFLTNAGRLGAGASGFQLDLRTLRSSNSELSSFIKSDIATPQFPMAEFVIESVDGIPATYTDGNEFSFTMSGQLTMHGQTKPATWTAKARQVGNFLTFAADTDFLLTDYGWTPPNYGVAKAKNSVHLQIVVVAAKAP